MKAARRVIKKKAEAIALEFGLRDSSLSSVIYTYSRQSFKVSGASLLQQIKDRVVL